jgi:hypothetical protein
MREFKLQMVRRNNELEINLANLSEELKEINRVL